MSTNVQETEFFVEDCHDHALLVKRLRNEMPTEESISDLAELFHSFADPTRMKILYALSQEELCVCAIAELLDMEHSAISHQLRKLRTANLVHCRREGRMAVYSLADEHVRVLISVGFEHCEEAHT